MAAEHEPRSWEDQLESLEREGQVSLPAVREAISWLMRVANPQPITHILDVGAGPGHAACAFAEAFRHARVTALDPTLPFLETAQWRARASGVADRLTTCHGDIETMSATLAPADLIWASHVIHHLPDPIEALLILRDRLVDGGLLAVTEGGLPVRVLPGGYGVARPSFPARLDAAMSDYWLAEWSLADVAVGGSRDWPLLLAEAGFATGRSKTFVIEHRAPLDDVVRDYIVERYDGFRDAVGDSLDREDADALDILLDPEDQRSLQRRPDLFLLTAHTIHTAFRRQ